MSLKESLTKYKHQRKTGSRLSSCFSGSPVDEAGNLESKTPEASCFSWSWFRKKKKKKETTVPVAADVPLQSISAAAQGKGERDKPLGNWHKAKGSRPRSNSKRQVQVQVQRQQQEQTTNVNAASASQGTTSLPRISAKYDTGSQLSNIVRTRTRTRHVGSSESNQLGEKSDHHPANLDHLVGLLVLMVTLAVMFVWGRACAVGCLCACFYLVPLLRRTTVTEGNSGGKENIMKVDIESEAYKKRVVLEGLLERNGRRLSRINSSMAPTTSLSKFAEVAARDENRQV